MAKRNVVGEGERSGSAMTWRDGTIPVSVLGQSAVEVRTQRCVLTAVVRGHWAVLQTVGKSLARVVVDTRMQRAQGELLVSNQDKARRR